MFPASRGKVLAGDLRRWMLTFGDEGTWLKLAGSEVHKTTTCLLAVRPWASSVTPPSLSSFHCKSCNVDYMKQSTESVLLVARQIGIV